MSLLSEQVVVVTGGSRGIGAGVCLRAAELGAKVVVNYSSNAGAAESLVSEITSKGGTALAMGFNVADEEAVGAAFKEIQGQFGKVDCLVNNAGIAIDGLVLRTKKDDWDQTVAVNLTGAFLCSKAAAKLMLKARSGRIVNVSSVVGQTGNAGQAAYAASKSGLFGMTKSLAKEFAGRGVTVNAVAPGYIRTDMTAEMSEAQTEQVLQQIPLGRLGEVEDIVEPIVFFLMPSSAYVTGQILGVSGGMYM